MMKLYFDNTDSMTLELSRCPAKGDLNMVIAEAEAISHVRNLVVLLLPAVYRESQQLLNELGFSVAGKLRDHSITKVKL
jgi:hypothetical protein